MSYWETKTGWEGEKVKGGGKNTVLLVEAAEDAGGSCPGDISGT